MYACMHTVEIGARFSKLAIQSIWLLFELLLLEKTEVESVFPLCIEFQSIPQLSSHLEVIFLPQHPMLWDYSHELSCLALESSWNQEYPRKSSNIAAWFLHAHLSLEVFPICPMLRECKAFLLACVYAAMYILAELWFWTQICTGSSKWIQWVKKTMKLGGKSDIGRQRKKWKEENGV